MRTTLFAVLLLALAATRADAQQPVLPLAEGERIRIAPTTLDPALAEARVAAVGPDFLAFRLEGDPNVTSRRLEWIDRVEVQRERSGRSRALRGVAWGVFLGTSMGGMSSPFIAYGTDSEMGDWGAVATGAAGGAVVGAAVGALVGALLPGSYWQTFEFVRAR